MDFPHFLESSRYSRNGCMPKKGDRFKLFDGTIVGRSTSLSLPALGEGLVWDASNLYTSGELAVRKNDPGTIVEIFSISRW